MLASRRFGTAGLYLRTDVSIPCHTCDEDLDDDAKFCGMCGAILVDENFERVLGDRYVVRQRIGAGSLGAVYRGVQRTTRRKVALKLLADTGQRGPGAAERFVREATVLMNLRSQHTISIYDFNREPDGTLYIVMEVSPGRSLAHVLQREGALPWTRVMRILLGLCDALGEAHTIGVIHRDLKPENILLEERATNQSFVKVSDFGLAKMLGTNLQISPVGQTVGAVEFASPESLLNRSVDARSDLYALGVLAYLLISGVHPFHSARSFGDMIAAHVQQTAAPLRSLRPDVPDDVDALVATLMQKNPDHRYPDAATVAAQLSLLMTGFPPEPGMTVRTDEGEEDTFLAEIPSRPK